MASDELEPAATISILQTFSGNASRISIALDGGKTIVAVKKPKGDLLEDSDFLLQSSTFSRNDGLVSFHPRALWLAHPKLKTAVEADLCDEVRKTWAAGIVYPEERRSKDGKVERIGLRPPQIGALHAIAAHFTVNKSPSPVVMPTGTGKTEVMLATSIMRYPERLLVLVPSDALRTQTYRKIIRLGLLRTIGVIGADVANPVVGVLRKSVRNKRDLQSIEKCNVVISTVAGLQHASTELLKQFCGIFDTVFFDEAHHVPANSWQRVIDTLQPCETPDQAAAYWKAHIPYHPYFNPECECLVVFILNTRRRIKGHYLVSIGTMDKILCHPREIFRLAVMASASAIIICHNLCAATHNTIIRVVIPLHQRRTSRLPAISSEPANFSRSKFSITSSLETQTTPVFAVLAIFCRERNRSRCYLQQGTCLSAFTIALYLTL